MACCGQRRRDPVAPGEQLKRSRLWEAETWPAGDALVSRAQMFLDHIPAPGVTVEQVEASLAESYRKNFY